MPLALSAVDNAPGNRGNLISLCLFAEFKYLETNTLPLFRKCKLSNSLRYENFSECAS
jgi:hypothetical protein